ncbi:hypothetical protein, partial [Thermogutta sp.]|uniref:hypothetical protein n=1 Tax=Thermogutta sp. TaxID=1962930 RepID=UPI0025F40A66
CCGTTTGNHARVSFHLHARDGEGVASNTLKAICQSVFLEICLIAARHTLEIGVQVRQTNLSVMGIRFA